MLTDRQKILLEAIIREYIKTAQAIASERLLSIVQMDISPATIRNDMVALEEDGYLVQPHTSAGRVPTEKAFRFYIDQCAEEKIAKKQTQIKSPKTAGESALKELAKNIAELTGETVVLEINGSTYCTGIGHLFSKPEFENTGRVAELGTLLDDLDEIMYNMPALLGDNLEILLGQDNPFGNDCGSIMVQISSQPKKRVVFGILGPMRMDYERNIAALRRAQEILSNLYF